MSWYQDPNVLMSMVMFFILGLYNARIRELKKQVAGLQRWRGEDVNPKNLDQYKRIQALEKFAWPEAFEHAEVTPTRCRHGFHPNQCDLCRKSAL